MYTAPIPSSVSDLIMALVGMETLAYIRPVAHGDNTGFGIFAADGTQLAVLETVEIAYYTAKQNNLEPVSIH